MNPKNQLFKKQKITIEGFFKTMLNKLMTGKIRVHKLGMNTKPME